MKKIARALPAMPATFRNSAATLFVSLSLAYCLFLCVSVLIINTLYALLFPPLEDNRGRSFFAKVKLGETSGEQSLPALCKKKVVGVKQAGLIKTILCLLGKYSN